MTDYQLRIRKTDYIDFKLYISFKEQFDTLTLTNCSLVRGLDHLVGVLNVKKTETENIKPSKSPCNFRPKTEPNKTKKENKLNCDHGTTSVNVCVVGK